MSEPTWPPEGWGQIGTSVEVRWCRPCAGPMGFEGCAHGEAYTKTMPCKHPNLDSGLTRRERASPAPAPVGVAP